MTGHRTFTGTGVFIRRDRQQAAIAERNRERGRRDMLAIAEDDKMKMHLGDERTPGRVIAGVAVPARATHERSRAVSALRVGIANAAAVLLLAGCASPEERAEISETTTQRGLLRIKLNQYCLANLPAGPRSTQYNDWDEVVGACSMEAAYQANGCDDPRVCLDALAQGTPTRSATTAGRGPQDRGPVGNADAPETGSGDQYGEAKP